MNFFRLFTLLIFVLCVYSTHAFAAPKKACIKADGSVIIKRRCRANKGQTQLSLGVISNSVQGLQGPKGDTGAQGPQGPRGPEGIAGDTGPSGILGYIASEDTLSGPTWFTNVGHFIEATCPAGYVVTGGSCHSNYLQPQLSASHITDSEDGWRCYWVNYSPFELMNFSITAKVLCALPPS